MSEADKETLTKLRHVVRSDDYLPTDLIEYRHMFNKYAKFHMFKTKTLMQMAYFMSVKPVTGLNTINNILKLIRMPQIPVDAPVVRHLTKFLIAREMNMLFRRLRQEDLLLDQENIDDMSDELLRKICF